MKLFLILLLGFTIWATCRALLALDVLDSKPDPPPTKKYCTIKLNDANNQTSYLTGECISNE